MRTIQDVIDKLPKPDTPQLVAPNFVLTPNNNKTVFAIEAMKRHMTDEGWQIMQGLSCHGYILAGKDLEINSVNTKDILNNNKPGTVVVQDKREWDPESTFTSLDSLKKREDVFTLTILKDAHQKPKFHMQSADEIGCNAWIIYYHPKIVHHLAPYTRPQHLIRTYHSINPSILPLFGKDKEGSLVSGAMFSRVYPLRSNIFYNKTQLPKLECLKHPGYHRKGCRVKKYLITLNRYKVAICTSSIYGYVLHKIIEATAVGCRVLTDLPTDEILPEIEDNLYRIPTNLSIAGLKKALNHLYDTYDYDLQQERAKRAIEFYNTYSVCKRLSEDIENLRQNY